MGTRPELKEELKTLQLFDRIARQSAVINELVDKEKVMKVLRGSLKNQDDLRNVKKQNYKIDMQSIKLGIDL